MKALGAKITENKDGSWTVIGVGEAGLKSPKGQVDCGNAGTGVRLIMGAAAAGASDEIIEAMREYGYNLGMSFQLVDDILDVIGDAEEMGKPVGLDVAQGRGVVVAEGSANGNGSYSNGAPAAVAQQLEDDDPVKKMMDRMRDSGALELAKMQAAEMGERARKALGPLPSSEIKDALDELVDMVVDRST